MNIGFDSQALRRALGNFATGVTVITAENADGQRVGMTANSFNSVSLEPPLILWSIDKNARSVDVFDSATHFAVNILAADQIDLSNRFARMQADKFEGVDWVRGAKGSPVLAGCAATFECENFDKLEGGDHWILLGKVIGFEDLGRSPLCYHQGTYSLVSNHPLGQKGSEPNATDESTNIGRLNDNVYYLMLKALHVYQAGYLPKQQALGLTVSEARAIFSLSDNPQQFRAGVPEIPNMPESEIALLLDHLMSRGLVAQRNEGYHLTNDGLQKAEELWALADSHPKSMFQELGASALGDFKKNLHAIIDAF
ncbi:MAG: flavin reductase family protein [Pseudomonadota bacterium]